MAALKLSCLLLALVCSRLVAAQYRVPDDEPLPPEAAPTPPSSNAGSVAPFLVGYVSDTQQVAASNTSDNASVNLTLSVQPVVSNAAPDTASAPGSDSKTTSSSPASAPTAPSAAPGLAPSPGNSGRHLLQGEFRAGNAKDIIWTVDMAVTDADGQEQGPFTVGLDTGSLDFILPGLAGPSPSFDPTGLSPTNTEGPVVSTYGGDVQYSYVGYFYAAIFQFIGATGKAATRAASNVLAADYVNAAGTVESNRGQSILGLGYRDGATVQRVPGAATPLIDFLNAAQFTYKAFTVFLNKIDPIPASYDLFPDQGQIAFGSTLPDLVDPANGITAPALFQNVDLACYRNKISPVFGTNWVVPINLLTSNPGQSPLGPDSINVCGPASPSPPPVPGQSATAGSQPCLAIVDTGFFELGVPAAVLRQIFVALGLGSNPDPAKRQSFGRTSRYPEIDCSVRDRATPSLDFLVQDRVYSQLPADYIQQDEVTGKCYVIIGDTGAETSFAFGAPFIAKYPGTFFTDTGLPAPLGGSSDGPRTCFYGTVPVVAQCAPQITLNATQGCSAVITQSSLLDQLHAGNRDVVFTSNPPSADRTQYTLQPSADASGHYTLPVGLNTFTLTATNALGSSSCTATVNVVDEEVLTDTDLSCGTPPDGVLLTSILGPDPAATYTPTAKQKQNGCPVAISVSALSCKNCLLGPDAPTTLAKCSSKVVGNSVQIDSLQEGRVHWSIVASNGNSTISQACDVCVSYDVLEKCPAPYSALSPCVAGKF